MKKQDAKEPVAGSGKPTTTELAKKELTQSERFTQEVMKQFTNNAGELQLTAFQKRLCQNYFIKIDQGLKDLEKKRMANDEKWRDPLAFTWANVNLPKLAVDVVAFSGVGLDPAQPNHINCIPYKNKATNKFDIGFIPGYRGIELKAKKYALDVPDDVVVELIYSTDKFKQIKKDMNNKIETYSFEVTDELNRGEIVGGFYYHQYKDKPEKNKIRVFNMEQIMKRKPEHASAEFWGGEKDKWEKDDKGKSKKVGKIKVEGWLDEMVYKTVFRAAYNAITIDSQKIDDHYMAVLEKEREQLDAKVVLEIRENANTGQAVEFEEETTTEQPVQPIEQQSVVVGAETEEEQGSDITVEEEESEQQPTGGQLFSDTGQNGSEQKETKRKPSF